MTSHAHIMHRNFIFHMFVTVLQDSYLYPQDMGLCQGHTVFDQKNSH